MGSSRQQTAGLAEKLYSIRSHLSLSQSQMVDRLKGQKLPSPLRVYAGNISRFEKGLREPPPLILLAYARTAGVTVEVLIDASLDLPAKMAQNPKVTQKRGATQKASSEPFSRKVARGSKRKLP
jgi:transcriptional regulator with XRE-family HTH domain